MGSRFFLTAFALTFLCLGCGKKGTNRFQGGDFDTRVTRGPRNQAQIVVNKAPRGQADQALAEAEGYTEATDRFVQMDMARRAVKGQLAEIFGSKALAKDQEAIGAGLRLAVRRTTDHIKKDYPESYELLSAYSDGVNRYIVDMDGDILDFYRRTTHDSRYEPEKWTPEDSVACALSMSFYLSSALKEKLALGRMASDFLDADKRSQITDLFDWRPIEHTFILDAARSKPKPTVQPVTPPVQPGHSPSDPRLPAPTPSAGAAPRGGSGGGARGGTPGATGGGTPSSRPSTPAPSSRPGPRSPADREPSRPLSRHLHRSGAPVLSAREGAALGGRFIPAGFGGAARRTNSTVFASPSRHPGESPRRNPRLHARSTLLASALGVGGACVELGFPFPECARKTGVGSNNWVVSPSFSGGPAFLANDPHLPLTQPMQMYEVALDSTHAGGSFRVRGFGLPGLPGILIGHNDFIGWGMTNLPADVDDVYIEVLDGTGTKALFNGELVTLTSEKVDLKVRQGDGSLKPVTGQGGKPLALRIVPHHGPIFSDFAPETSGALSAFADKVKGSVSGVENPMIAISYKWTGHEGTGEIPAILGVNRAKDFEGFKRALESFDTGAQNMVFLDTAGDIGYYAHGKFPVRRLRADWPPYLPQLGTGSTEVSGLGSGSEWDGYKDTFPELYNPSAGRIITANNDPTGQSAQKDLGTGDKYLGYAFSTGIRARRITDLLDQTKKAKGRVTFEDNAAIQTDHSDLLLLRFAQMLSDNTDRIDFGEKPKQEALMKRLAKFNGQMPRGATEPVVVHRWVEILRDQYYASVLPQGKSLPEGGISATMVAKTLYNKLWDQLTSFQNEKPAEILQASLEQLSDQIDKEKLGSQTWGQVHLSYFSSIAGPLLGAPLGPISRDGSWESVDCAGQNIGPAFRLILVAKKGSPFEAYTSVPGGNYPPSHDDFGPELNGWRDGKYRALVSFR